MILAIDQGTTGTTCLVVDAELRVLGRGYTELTQSFPQPGWIEHDPEEIWQTVVAATEAAVRDARVQPRELSGIGDKLFERVLSAKGDEDQLLLDNGDLASE